MPTSRACWWPRGLKNESFLEIFGKYAAIVTLKVDHPIVQRSSSTPYSSCRHVHHVEQTKVFDWGVSCLEIVMNQGSSASSKIGSKDAFCLRRGLEGFFLIEYVHRNSLIREKQSR